VHLYLFLVVIVSLGCGSLPPADTDPLRAAGATVAMVLAWALLTHVGARVCANQVRREQLDPLVGATILEQQLAAFRWLGLGVVVLCLAGFGLARSLESVAILERSIVLQALILLMPGMAILAATWSAENCYGMWLGYTRSGLKNHLRSMWQSFRSGVAWLIAPVLIVMGMSDLIAMLPISPTLAGWLTAAMILFLVPLGLPWLIRHLFRTSRLNAAEDAWIGELVAAAGLRRTRAVRWQTGGQSFNAMVAGFVPPLRTLLISDRLLDELPREQIAMVVLHEAAHLRRRHVPIRMLSILPAWAAGALVTHLAGEHSWALAAGTLVGIAMTMWILRLVAYRTEFDADFQACRMAVEVSAAVDHVPETFERAAEALALALQRVTFDQPQTRKATWLHPGVADRVDWIRRQRAEPSSKTAIAGTMANPA
jgi:Zn-dependent protease with chaperone function